ncbi:MAG TPA: hypothetical protein VI248_06665 [Kineosporiaceae bacterium]
MPGSTKLDLDLNPTKLAGGALAAVTSAVTASYFGVTGTIMGAAFGSVVSSVAAALYATSLTRAGERIKTVVVSPSGAVGGTGRADPADPAAVPDALTGAQPAILGETMLPRSAGRSAGQGSHAPSRRLLKPVLLLGGFAFAASLGAISATELALGHPVADAGESGTTVSRFVRGDPDSSPKAPEPRRGESPAASFRPSPSDPSSVAVPTSESGGPSGSGPSSGSVASSGPDASSGSAASGGQTTSPADSAPTTPTVPTTPTDSAGGGQNPGAPPRPTGGTLGAGVRPGSSSAS